MGRTARIIGGTNILLAPVAMGIGDSLRMRAEPASDTEYGVALVAERFASIGANEGLYLAASYLLYLAALLTIPALLALWRLAVARAPRWAWAGAILATLGVFGQAVHLMGYFGLSQAMAAQSDLTAAAELYLTVEDNAFAMALFVPFLLGMLAVIPQVVALRRASVLPRWSVVVVLAAFAMAFAAGSTPWSAPLYAALIVTAFTPAAAAMLTGRTEPSTEVVAPAFAPA